MRSLIRNGNFLVTSSFYMAILYILTLYVSLPGMCLTSIKLSGNNEIITVIISYFKNLFADKDWKVFQWFQRG